jgi:hypothetical protein
MRYLLRIPDEKIYGHYSERYFPNTREGKKEALRIAKQTHGWVLDLYKPMKNRSAGCFTTVH